MMNSTLATTRFWLVRHGPVRDHRGVVYGQTDWDCVCDDQQQLVWLVKTLPKEAVHVASALRRTWQTADALYQRGFRGSLLQQMAGLSEQSFGVWEGLSYDEMNRQFPAEATTLWWAPARMRPRSSPQFIGESFVDLCARVKQAQQELLRLYPGQDIVVFAHGGTIRAFLAIAMDIVDTRNDDCLEGIFAIRIENLSLTRVNHVAYRDDTQDQQSSPSTYWRIGLINGQCRVD